MDCSPPGSSVQGIFRARILEWVVISYSRASCWPRNWIHVSCTGRQVLYHWAPGKPPSLPSSHTSSPGLELSSRRKARIISASQYKGDRVFPSFSSNSSSYFPHSIWNVFPDTNYGIGYRSGLFQSLPSWNITNMIEYSFLSIECALHLLEGWRADIEGKNIIQHTLFPSFFFFHLIDSSFYPLLDNYKIIILIIR